MMVSVDYSLDILKRIHMNDVEILHQNLHTVEMSCHKLRGSIFHMNTQIN